MIDLQMHDGRDDKCRVFLPEGHPEVEAELLRQLLDLAQREALSASMRQRVSIRFRGSAGPRRA